MPNVDAACWCQLLMSIVDDDQCMAIPKQNSAKISVSPCFARVQFCLPVFGPFFCLFLPVFCPVLPLFCRKMPVFARLVWFRPNSPEFVCFRSSCACAVRYPLMLTVNVNCQCWLLMSTVDVDCWCWLLISTVDFDCWLQMSTVDVDFRLPTAYCLLSSVYSSV